MSRAVVGDALTAVSSLGADGTAPRTTASIVMMIVFAVIGMIAVVALASAVRPVHLAIGFGATVAMWALGYVAMTAPGLPVGEVLFGLMLLCVGAAGMIAARRGGSARSGLVVGLVSAGANLLIVGSLFGGRPSISIEVERAGEVMKFPLFEPKGGVPTNETMTSAPFGMTVEFADAERAPRVAAVAERSIAQDAGVREGDRIRQLNGKPVRSAADLPAAQQQWAQQLPSAGLDRAVWGFGLLVVSGALGWIGGAIGIIGIKGASSRGEPIRDPATLMAMVTAAAVLLLLITGGLVTGMEAGLAVPDWPNTFGHNMLLYPISEMVGGIYYEHAHRLFGMLVGVTSLVLVTVVVRSDRRASVRSLAVVLLVAVILQGFLGAMRVTGSISTSEHRVDHAPSVVLAVVHGVVAQGIFALSLLLAAMLGTRWRSELAPRACAGAGTMRMLSKTLVVLLLLQLVLGACYRHLFVPPSADQPGSSPLWALHSHLTLAAVIMVLALLAGFRAKALGRDEGVPIVPTLGRLLHIIVGVQILLGVGALVAVLTRASEAIPAWEIIVTSAHQATGAILLGLALLLAAWSQRLLCAPAGAATAHS